jgi:Trypsin.
MKKGLIALLSIVLLISAMFSLMASAHNPNESGLNTQFMTEEELVIYERSLRQYDAVIYYDEMISTFFDEYGEKSGQPACYPERYAGAYINDEGKLVIQIAIDLESELLTFDDLYNEYAMYVDLEAIKETDEVFEAGNINDLVVFEQVEYSLNDLNLILERAVSEIGERYPTIGYYVDTLNNTVAIEFTSAVYEEAIVDEKAPLVFCVSETYETTASHIGGQGYYTVGGYNYSLGFTGYYLVNSNNQNQLSYLTCGHNSSYSVGDNIVYNGNVVGTVGLKQWSNNGTGDWAVVYLNSSQTISGLIKKDSSGTTGKIKARVQTVPVNTIVYRFGNATQSWQSLEVTVVNCTESISDSPTNTTYTIKSLVKCKRITGTNAQGGDSGGPIVIVNGSNYSAVGVLSAQLGDAHLYNPMTNVPGNFSVAIG